MPGGCQADMETDCGLVGSTMAHYSGPSHQAHGPTERQDDNLELPQ